MTQRIFDIENEKDMQDLWDILPDDVVRLSPMINKDTTHVEFEDDETYTIFFKIDWHDKAEITRPIQEVTEADIGKICYFWDNDGVGTYGKLSSFILEDSPDRKFGSEYGSRWQHARRLTKQEIEELC